MLSLNSSSIHSYRRTKYTIKRVGRGIGSGLGKTGGRGHKGQKSRSGGKVKARFEGGQTPLYRRLPKFGFRSRNSALVREIALSKLSHIADDVIDINVLKTQNIVGSKVKSVKIIMPGEINRPVIIRNLFMSKSVRAVIQTAGGKIEGE